jgi:hypothetical protein
MRCCSTVSTLHTMTLHDRLPCCCCCCCCSYLCVQLEAADSWEGAVDEVLQLCLLQPVVWGLCLRCCCCCLLCLCLCLQLEAADSWMVDEVLQENTVT